MHMAKATDADLQAALDVSNILEDISKGYMPILDAKNETDEDVSSDSWFDLHNKEQTNAILERLISLAKRANLFRVSFGMTVLLDPTNKIVDPNSDILRHHPDVISGLNDSRRLAWLTSTTLSPAAEIERATILAKISLSTPEEISSLIDSQCPPPATS